MCYYFNAKAYTIPFKISKWSEMSVWTYYLVYILNLLDLSCLQIE